MSASPDSSRLNKSFVDWVAVVRLVAIFMVLASHMADNVAPAERALDSYKSWVPYFGSIMRPCVPLFVMLTGFLLLPVRESMGTFYAKRISRVAIPFVLWIVIYNAMPYIMTAVMGMPGSDINTFFCWYDPATIAVASPMDVLMNSLKSLLFFNVFTTHLWYIFVVVGLYLYLPIFSAWVAQASGRQKGAFLAIWGATLCIPYIREIGGLNLLGACGWNEFHMLYYFAGFNGYLLLGHVLGNAKELNWGKTLLLAIPAAAVGYIVTVVGFDYSLNIPEATEAQIELFYTYCSPNVVLLTAAMFLVLRKMHLGNFGSMRKALTSLSQCSFGIYLSHYLFLGPLYHAVADWTLPRALTITIISVIALLINWAFVALLRHLPKSKWITG